MKLYAKLVQTFAGFDREQKVIEDLVDTGKLVVGNKYELKSAIIGSWSTKIQLTFMPKDIPYFNSVFFKFYSDEGIELDITNREVIKTYSHLLVFE